MSDENKPDLPATTKDLVDATLNFCTNLLTMLDLPASVVKNAYKALGRLSSAAIEVPVAYLEGKSAEIRAIGEARIKIIEAGPDRIVQQMEVPPEYAQVAVDKYVGKIIGEQLNLDKISAITANALKSGEPDSLADHDLNEPNKGRSADSTNQDTNGGEEKIISDVWLNIFETEARPQSTAEGQLLFGRILAGEIKQPGSYSIRTVRTLGELDLNTAILFKRLCSLCVALANPDNGFVADARVLSLDGNAAQNALSKYGLGFHQLNILNEYGLIISDYNSWLNYSVHREGDKESWLLRHQGIYWDLQLVQEQVKNQEFKLSGVALSRVGRELFRIVDQDPMPEYTEDLKKFFARQKLQMVEVPSSGPVVFKRTM